MELTGGVVVCMKRRPLLCDCSLVSLGGLSDRHLYYLHLWYPIHKTPYSLLLHTTVTSVSLRNIRVICQQGPQLTNWKPNLPSSVALWEDLWLCWLWSSLLLSSSWGNWCNAPNIYFFYVFLHPCFKRILSMKQRRKERHTRRYIK